MKSMNNLLKKVLFVLFTFSMSSLLFSGCGYKPTVEYAKKEITGKVFVKLFVDLKDPKNSVLIKDAMNELLSQKLGNKLVYKEVLADSIMYLKINSVTLSTLQYDEDGYNKLYKLKTDILVDYYKKRTNKSNKFLVSGENNFSVDDGSTISDAKRFSAIKSASDDALDEVLSKIAISSFK